MCKDGGGGKTRYPAPDFMSRCKQNKKAGLALVYSDQECWDVESPIIASVTQALNCDMGDRAVAFSTVERLSESVADYCDIKGKTWLVTRERFTGWVSVFYFAGAASSKELIKVFRDIFTTFGVPQEITTDGGPQFSSHDLVLLLEKWGCTA